MTREREDFSSKRLNRTSNEKELPYLPVIPGDHMESLYDTASGGLGNLMHALREALVHPLIPLSPKLNHELGYFHSNWLRDYSLLWIEHPNRFVQHGLPENSLNAQHLALLRATQDDCDQIHRAQLRVVLGGEAQCDIALQGHPFQNQAEFIALLETAEKKGLLSLPQHWKITSLRRILYLFFLNDGGAALRKVLLDKTQIKVVQDIFGIIMDNRHLISATDDLLHQVEEIEASIAYRPATMQIAWHKLACMLAVLDDFTHLARVRGKPFSRSYKPPYDPALPEDVEGNVDWATEWRTLFGMDLPPLGELYAQAHALLKANADLNDPYIQHILAMDTLPQLVD